MRYLPLLTILTALLLAGCHHGAHAYCEGVLRHLGYVVVEEA